jgi:hypothetical protein
MITILFFLCLLARPALAAESCSALQEPPPVFQVAWVSPLQQDVSSRAWLEVVRVADLRAFVKKNGPDTIRLLQGLGLAKAKGLGWLQAKQWKITMFDVEAAWVCRPVKGAEEGLLLQGIPACVRGQQKGEGATTGCGYSRDPVTGGRGIDVFRIRWRDAARGGFCVMPLSRFVAGA